MEELRLSVKDKQDARMALLNYYSSECIAHGAYFMALAVGFFGLVQASPRILEFAAGVASPTLPKEFVMRVVLSLMASGFISLIIYVLVRAIFWGYLTSAIIKVKPKEGSEVGSEPETTVTFMRQLHEACFDYVKRKHGILIKLLRVRLALIWLGLFVVFLIISVILLYVP